MATNYIGAAPDQHVWNPHEALRTTDQSIGVEPGLFLDGQHVDSKERQGQDAEQRRPHVGGLVITVEQRVHGMSPGLGGLEPAEDERVLGRVRREHEPMR